MDQTVNILISFTNSMYYYSIILWRNHKTHLTYQRLWLWKMLRMCNLESGIFR